jgi:hypothetical protein
MDGISELGGGGNNMKKRKRHILHFANNPTIKQNVCNRVKCALVLVQCLHEMNELHKLGGGLGIMGIFMTILFLLA